MRKLKLLIAACALLTLGGGNLLQAQTDVTSTYITKADFSSTTGWTQYVSSGYKDIGNGLIGTWGVRTAEGQAVSTKDETHLETEYCFGFECRWETNYASYNQTTSTLPVGAYTLTFDVENTNSKTTKATYNNLFYVEIGGNKTTDTSTEWMNGKSSWTTHTISFNITEATTAVVSFGYGTGSNNYASANTPTLHVSHLKLTWTDPNVASAKVVLNGYIKKATALNGVLADETLAGAITTAQGVYDDSSVTSSAVESASTTLSGAITTALSGATAVSLTNGNFDSTPNLLADGTVGNNDVFYYNTNNASEAYNYNVTGWTNASVVSGNASFGGTGEYGSTATICGTTPPAADMFGASEGAALALADGWGSTSRYQQVKEAMPAGRYMLYYEAYNQNTATGIGSNYFGASGTAGDFYGTTNSFVYDENKTFASGEWKATAIEFDVAKAADITIGVGMDGSNGSGSNAKLWIDNVLVYRIGDVIVSDADASTLISSVEALDDAVYNATDKSALASAKTAFVANKTLDNYNALNTALVTAQNSVTVYMALAAAITKVEGWTSDAETVTDPIRTKYTNGTYSDETTAADIYSEYQAAELAALATADATDYTSAILNASFETGDMTGWSAESRTDTGVKANSDGTYTTSDVEGDYLFNSWGGTAENNVYQTIKNLPAGTYQLSALLAGFNGEELVLAANETTNSVTVTGDKTTGNTVNVVFTLDEATDVLIKASNTKSQSTSDASFIKADNFTLQAYSDPLAAYKEQLTALKSQATTALGNEDYANVTGDEKTTLTAKAAVTPAETEEAYTTAISELTAAISTFTAAKSAYDANVTAKATTVPTLKYAATAKKTALQNAIDATVATAEVATENTAAITTALRAYYESHALAEGVDGAVNMTSSITNASDPTNNDGWTWSGSKNNPASNESWTDADGTSNHSYFDGGNWSGSAWTTTMSQTVQIPAGKYLLTAKARAAENVTFTMAVGENSVNLPHIGSAGNVFDRGWGDASLEFTSEGKGDEILVSASSSTQHEWFSISDFRLVRLELNSSVYAGATEYAALNSAISDAEAKTLGFDEGEYAPYKNIEAIEALIAAKAIDQTAELINFKTDVEAATTALSGATWTVNVGEVNAIYDGQFANTAANSTSGDITLPGWTKVDGIRLLVKDQDTDKGLAYTDGKAAVFSWGGTTLTYGSQTGYTLPMAKHTLYELTFKVSAWRDGAYPTVVTVGLDGATQTVNNPTVAPINTSDSNPFASLKFYVTPTEDNSVLTIYANQHFTIADLSLVKAVAENVTIAETTDYTPAKNYANVTFNRTFVEGWNGLVLPFDATAEEVKNIFNATSVKDLTGITYSAADGVTLNFANATKVTAGKPFLVKVGANPASSYTINGVILPETALQTVDMTAEGNENIKYTMTGTYAATTDLTDVTFALINGTKYYYHTAGVNASSAKAFRAYFVNNSTEAKAGSRVKFDFGNDMVTGIETVESSDWTVDNKVYNLQGQRIGNAQSIMHNSQLKPGLYIVNGRKVMLK